MTTSRHHPRPYAHDPTPNSADDTGDHREDDNLTSAQVARHLRVRSSDLRAAARRLGMVAGVTVNMESGTPVVRRSWPRDWIEELRTEVERREEIDIDEVCGGSCAD